MRYLVAAVVRRQLLERRRYLADTDGLLVAGYVVFLLILFGAGTLAGNAGVETTTPSAIAIGYVLTTLATLAYATLAQGVSNESSTGTLEQLAMSPFGLVRVLGVQAAVSTVFQLVEMSLLLLLAVATTGQGLLVRPLALPVVLLTLLGVQGIGFAMAGLALVVKRVAGFSGLLPLAFVGLAFAPLDSAPALKALPLGHGAQMVRGLLVYDRTPSVGDLALLTAVSVAWLGVGVLAFRRLERVARDRALLGQY